MTNNQTDNWTLRDIWDIFLENIWIYIASCSIAVAIAIAYIVVTPPMYERSASILIKSDNQDPMSQSFEDIGFFKSNTDIGNEIRVLKTKSMMTEVVNRLNLNYIYKQNKRGLRWVDIYKRTPFAVIPDRFMQINTFSFDVEFTGSDAYEISNLVVNGHKITSGEMTGQIDKPFETPYGAFTLINTPFFEAGSTIGEQFSFAKISAEDLAQSLISRLRISLSNEGTSIIDLTITDERLERADNVLNTLISVYNENWIKDRNEITFNTSEFIDSRLLVIEKELESVDGSIAEFKSESLMPDIATVAGIHLQQSTQNKSEQLMVTNQLSMANYIKGYLQSATSGDKLLPANTGIENSAIETQIGRYNELLLQKNILLSNSSENNPMVADMTKQLQSIKDIINISISDHISTLAIQLSNLQAQEGRNREKLSSTPKQEKELLGVERQQMIKEQLFLYLLQKREENELSQAFSAYNTKVLSAADGSHEPKEPKMLMILMFALALGVILPTLFIIIKESFDTLIKSKKDLEGLNIPYVGTIPFIPQRGDKSETTFVASVTAGSRDSAGEAFRVLRTNLDFMVDNSKSGAQVIQLISLLPGSGKSFVSTNLALSMALKDVRVLVVDCDIRKKTLSRLTTPSGRLGVSDYLNGKVENPLEIVIKGSLNENLDILPAGTTPPNPSELLLKPRFEQMVSIMREHYDYIFIDCPPVEIVPDAAIIAKVCDSSIFVIRAESLDKRLLPEIEAIYESKKYNHMCVLLNGVKSKGKGYGYNSYRRYGYYGYGYSSE